MEKSIDIYKTIQGHRSRFNNQKIISQNNLGPEIQTDYLTIPELFFSEILPNIKLSRIEIVLLMHLYGLVWCRANLYAKHGISPLISLNEMAKKLNIGAQEQYLALKRLEDLDFIKTIRSGQFFVRRFFLKELDDAFEQDYDDFEA